MESSNDNAKRVRLFARYAEIMGADEVDVVVPLPATVRDIVTALKAQYPSAAALPDQPLVAVNLAQVGQEHAVTAQDEMALLPPVAGG